MRSFGIITLAALAVGIVSSQAQASVIITQSAAPAPTYSILLNFDEPGGATGVNVPNNSWSAAPWNIPVFQSGDTIANFVGDNSGATAQGTNSYYGPFGVFIEFGQDLTELSFQGWDNGGPPSPFGGGAIVAAFNDGVDVAVLPITPAWGGVGDSWFNITTTGGMVFDELRFLGFDFFPQSVVDNLSWNVVPEPGSLALLGLGIVGVLRRRAR
ncbi:MAG: PEP-CTERM sorting domain-containing protein [Planctomycetia bacterium]|jgi:hypothetical protein|nr:PEP-CTERM sorting domain-containing protein [Planctomycetia bacterium]MCC7316369.1 PEP-CTERM sorting domain-containing protein [Planctomycetota bacterium]OQZ05941.1 MAG: hypothetical protein B6D36_07565 [Planctomycetes bacterium UTPLA1]